MIRNKWSSPIEDYPADVDLPQSADDDQTRSADIGLPGSADIDLQGHSHGYYLNLQSKIIPQEFINKGKDRNFF